MYRDTIPLKKRKIEVIENDDDGFIIPSTEHKMRKKCAILDDGLAIKYNKLVQNFDKIMSFKRFRRYCVFFDIFSKRHLINHCYRIDLLEKLNCFDYAPYAFEMCYCNRAVYKTCAGYLTAFKSQYMHRKKYSNHGDGRSEFMKSLYIKHSTLSEDNNFFDNRISECFRKKIQKFEKLNSLLDLDRKTVRKLHKYMCQSIPSAVVCSKCKNLQNTNFGTWNIIRYINCININTLCDYVIRIDDNYYTPNYKTNNDNDENTNIIVYKSTKSNIVFLLDDIFYVIHPSNVLIVFDIATFERSRFFCNFTFYLVKKTSKYYCNNFIHINKN